jgi:hypothetical protein
MPTTYSPDFTFTTIASTVAYSTDQVFTTLVAPPSGVPAAPTGLTATATSPTQITLAWVDVATTESGYALERATAAAGPFGQIADLPAGATGHADTGRSPSTPYWYRVRAYNVSGPSAYSNTATATTPAVLTVPVAPTGLAATAGASSIALQWTDNATTESGYEVERATAGVGGPFSLLATLGANATAHSDISAAPGTPYWYRVRATNAQGPSAYSNTATATVPAPPTAAPSGLTATAVSAVRVDLAWTDNAGNETAYEVERATAGSGGPFVLVATKAANATAHSDGSVAASTAYWYRVRATNAQGASGYSGTATATTPAAVPVPDPPADGALCPGVQVLIAFASKPTDAPVWTDVSAWARAFSFTRGRSTELEPVQAGTGTLVLDNRDRRFDPTNTAGPHSGQLKKRKRVRLRAVWAGSTYDLFTGYAEDWGQRWEGPVDSTTEVPLVDGLGVLARAAVPGAFPAQRADQRIADLLDEASWTVGGGWLLGSPAQSILGASTVLGSPGDRLLSEADSTLVATVYGEDADALSAARAAEASERGLLYADRAGAIRFRSRQELQQAQRTPLAVFGDLGPWTGELPYAGLEVDVAGGPHYTRARVAWGPSTARATAQAQDDAAVLDYYPLVLSVDTLLDSAAAAESLAGQLVADYKEPLPRVARLEHDPALAPGLLWPHLLGRDLGDVVEVRRRPPGGGPLFVQRGRLDSVEVRYEAGDRTDTATWGVAWRLSPPPTADPWILGDTTASVLGATTRLLF